MLQRGQELDMMHDEDLEERVVLEESIASARREKKLRVVWGRLLRDSRRGSAICMAAC
jgi:hypothetical protein